MAFVMVAYFALLNLSNSTAWVLFGIVIDQSESYFSMSKAEVNSLATVFEIMYVAFGLASMYVHDRFGVRAGLRAASGFNVTGHVLKLVCVIWVPHFVPVFVAMAFVGMGMVFDLAAPPLIAATWFKAEHQTTVTSVCALANMVSLAIGQLVTPQVITPSHNTRDRWLMICGAQLGLAAIDTALIFLVIPRQPACAPSAAAELRRESKAGLVSEERRALTRPDSRTSDVINFEEPADDASSTSTLESPGPTRSRANSIASATDIERSGMLSGIAMLLRNRDAMLVLAAGGLTLMCSWTYTGIISELFKPAGFSEAICGWMGAANLLVGTAVALPIGGVIDRTHRYRLSLILCGVVGAVCFGLQAVFVAALEDAVAPVFAASVLGGVAGMCALSAYLQLLVELSFPLDEAISSTTVMIIANVLSVAAMFGLADGLLGNPATKAEVVWTLGVFAGVSVVTCALLLFSRENLKRLEYEQLDNDEGA